MRECSAEMLNDNFLAWHSILHSTLFYALFMPLSVVNGTAIVRFTIAMRNKTELYKRERPNRMF